MSTQSKHRFLTAIEQSHGRELRRFLANRLPGRSADVPDLVQEIFLRLLRIKDDEAIRNPQAYLFTVASHVLHQHALKRSTKPELMDPLDVAMVFPTATAPDPADQLEVEQSLERIGRELREISPRAYAVLIMYRCEGMTLTEIGKRLGVSHVMVRKYLLRAIEYCDQRLEGTGVRILMNQPLTPTPLNPQIRAQATDWLLKFSEGEVDPKQRRDFIRWLRTSPEHVRAYLGIVAFWQGAPHLQGGQSEDMDTLIQLAQGENNVVPFNDPLSPGSDAAPQRRGMGKRIRPLALAAALLLATVGLATWFHAQRGLYTTTVGEQRTVNLSDGSTVTIDALSRLRVAYTKTERKVDLLEGQVLFKVAKNPARPFIVQSHGVRVRAVGTQFDVYNRAAGTVVTVVEGKVAVETALAPPADTIKQVPGLPAIRTLPVGENDRGSRGRGDGEVLVAAGEQAIVTGHSAVKLPNPNITAATAWTQGLLVFDRAPLSEVVQEFNRQNARTIVLAAPDLPRLEISGTFPATGEERIVRFLQERFNVSVAADEHEIRISRP